MSDTMQRTSSSKNEVAVWEGNEVGIDLTAAGGVVTITPPGNFRLMRIACHFDAGVAPIVTIDQVNQAGALWNQNIRTVTLPAASEYYTLIGGQGYEYRLGDSITITFSAVAATVYVSWETEQI